MNQPSTPPTGPKPMSPAARKRLQQCFERGKDLASREDHDYAHTMFVECVANDPSNLEYVEALLGNLQRKYKNNKKGARMKGFGGKGAFKKAVAARDYDQVFRLGLEILKTNPWDIPTLRALAEACKYSHYNDVELRYLKNALDSNPKDIEVNRHCAESLARMGQFDQAIACWHRIEVLDKKNPDAKKRIGALTTAKQTGVPPSAEVMGGVAPVRNSPRPTEAGSDATTNVSRPGSTSRTAVAVESEFTQLEKRVHSDDSGIEDLKRLIRLYHAEGRHRDALQTIKRSLDAHGSNLQIRELYEDAQVEQMKSQLAIAEKRAADEKTTESADLARRFKAELNRVELQTLAARTERYPQNLKLQYELGIRLKREGNFREGAKAFDAARADTELRLLATLEMGECCQHLKQYSNAMKCYQAAVSASEGDSSERKLALYRASVLGAALKNYEISQKFLEELVSLDPDFKDAATRLDKVREIRDKE